MPASTAQWKIGEKRSFRNNVWDSNPNKYQPKSEKKLNPLFMTQVKFLLVTFPLSKCPLDKELIIKTVSHTQKTLQTQPFREIRDTMGMGEKRFAKVDVLI